MAKSKPVIVGVDLAGSPRRPTGVCILRRLNIVTEKPGIHRTSEVRNGLDISGENCDVQFRSITNQNALT